MNYLHTGTIIATTIAACLVIALFAVREAWRRGIQYAHDQMGNIRAQYADALEEQEGRHMEEIRQINIEHRLAIRKMLNQNQQEQARAAALEAEYARLHDELAAKLQAYTTAVLSPTEIQLLEDMAGKLRLASPVLHAHQQFAEARKTKELASRGEVLLNRLRPLSATAEDAA